jgi:hypothetical protein
VYGAFWGGEVGESAHAKVQRSADRYMDALK